MQQFRTYVRHDAIQLQCWPFGGVSGSFRQSSVVHFKMIIDHVSRCMLSLLRFLLNRTRPPHVTCYKSSNHSDRRLWPITMHRLLFNAWCILTNVTMSSDLVAIPRLARLWQSWTTFVYRSILNSLEHSRLFSLIFHRFLRWMHAFEWYDVLCVGVWLAPKTMTLQPWILTYHQP